MKKSLFTFIITLAVFFNFNDLFAQGNVAINNTNANPHPSAILDVSANDKGMLVPRMTTMNRTMIANPAKGLLVFDLNTDSFWYYDGGVWVELGAGSGTANSLWNTTTDGIEYKSGTVNTDSIFTQKLTLGDTVKTTLDETALNFANGASYNSFGLSQNNSNSGDMLTMDAQYGLSQFNLTDPFNAPNSFFDRSEISFTEGWGGPGASLGLFGLSMYNDVSSLYANPEELKLEDENGTASLNPGWFEATYDDMYASLSAATLQLSVPERMLNLDPYALMFSGNNGISDFSSSELEFIKSGQGSRLTSSLLTFTGADVTRRLQLGAASGGYMNMFSKSGEQTVWLSGGTSSEDVGRLFLYDQAKYKNVVLTNLSGHMDKGFIGTYNGQGSQRTWMYTNSANVGMMSTSGANGRNNIVLSYLSGNSNNGFISVHDASGNNQAGAYVASDGRGIIYGDVKNFRMEHPEKEGKEIWYASLEGPEAAAYERGTAKLENGEVFVEFSEHFQLVANAETMTVVLTPMSADTYGLAVVEKTANGFKVKELMNREGNFQFDWEVKCVRKGYEDFRVIRDASEMATPKLETGAGMK